MTVEGIFFQKRSYKLKRKSEKNKQKKYLKILAPRELMIFFSSFLFSVIEQRGNSPFYTC